MTTKTKSFPIIIFLLLSFTLLTSATTQGPSQIIHLFRHGARGPLNGFDKSWPNYEWGVLTAAGTRQHFILGKALAQKYPGFFSRGYNPFQIYVLSDTTHRCIKSAQAQLDGIFDNQGPSFRADFHQEVAVPPFVDPEVQKTASNIHFNSALPSGRVPTIINIVDETNAAIFQANRGHNCPNNLKWERDNNSDRKAYDAWYRIFKPTIDNVNAHIGPKYNIKGTFDVISIGDAMLVNIYDNRTILGNITDPMLIANFTSAFSWFLLHVEHGQLQQRQLAAYHIVEAMLQQMEAFKKGVKYHQVAMFSGHDYNIYALLAAFGVVNEECLLENFYSYVANQTTPHPTCVFPQFAANIILEFYNQTNQVKFLYNNMVIPICQGKETCDYEEFLFISRNATGNNTLTSFQEQCGLQVTNTSKTSEEPKNTWIEESEKAKNISIEGPEKVKNNLKSGKDLMKGGTSNTYLLIALGVMTAVCLILLTKVLVHQRQYSMLVDEVKEMRTEPGFNEDDKTEKLNTLKRLPSSLNPLVIKIS